MKPVTDYRSPITNLAATPHYVSPSEKKTKSALKKLMKHKQNGIFEIYFRLMQLCLAE